MLIKFYNDSVSYTENCKIVEDDKLCSDIEIYLDIVDASNNFRALKMRSLKDLVDI